ncbi:uncharacterized protein LOC126610233 [Malus sylvestris]|uniref:uncharacterized protein LOC126610233 n=1 Tax=Malus sylvestris TaxID=3752 RepID=UPI0021AC0AE7|nr:uncharacterized protein LOC126610233 [Malus sylvestris]
MVSPSKKPGSSTRRILKSMGVAVTVAAIVSDCLGAFDSLQEKNLMRRKKRGKKRRRRKERNHHAALEYLLLQDLVLSFQIPEFERVYNCHLAHSYLLSNQIQEAQPSSPPSRRSERISEA